MTPAASEPGESHGNGLPTRIEEEALLQEVIRLSRNVLGLTLGILFAVGIFLATNILVLKGGPAVGSHLQLLNQYFPVTELSEAVSGAAYGSQLLRERLDHRRGL
jgi:hypothetical protein